jgi:hypothetical protein
VWYKRTVHIAFQHRGISGKSKQGRPHFSCDRAHGVFKENNSSLCEQCVSKHTIRSLGYTNLLTLFTYSPFHFMPDCPFAVTPSDRFASSPQNNYPPYKHRHQLLLLAKLNFALVYVYLPAFFAVCPLHSGLITTSLRKALAIARPV